MVVIDEAYAEFSGVTVVPWIRKFLIYLSRAHFQRPRD